MYVLHLALKRELEMRGKVSIAYSPPGIALSPPSEYYRNTNVLPLVNVDELT